ncbi:MAG: NUDIX domain-containing protein [Anaerolineales bacterium]|nr:NUDIX domain-containing protein [Anaerolineales bacterium]
MGFENMRYGAAAVIQNEVGEVLLVKHAYGRLNWELPGGEVESNEHPFEAVVREVREETGLDVVVERMSGIYHEIDAGFFHYVFLCSQSEESQEPSPSDEEISECKYWSIGSFPRPISEFTIRRIVDAVAGKFSPLPVTISTRNWIE